MLESVNWGLDWPRILHSGCRWLGGCSSQTNSNVVRAHSVLIKVLMSNGKPVQTNWRSYWTAMEQVVLKNAEENLLMPGKGDISFGVTLVICQWINVRFTKWDYISHISIPWLHKGFIKWPILGDSKDNIQHMVKGCHILVPGQWHGSFGKYLGIA